MRKILLAAVIAATFVIGITGVVSAHQAEPAWRCHTQISVELAAIASRNNADIGAAAAAVAACEGVTAIAQSVPSSPFGYGFPAANYGYGYNYHPYAYGFGSSSFGFGFGSGGALCPAGSGLQRSLTVNADGSPAGYFCQFGATGFGVSAICGGGYHLVETVVAPEPVYECVL